MKRIASSLVLISCLLLSGCNYNLYEKAGLITPEDSIRLDFDTVSTGSGDFNLYDLTTSDSGYAITIPASEKRTGLDILKDQDEDAEWKLIEALEYHSGAGTLETFLSSQLSGEGLAASRGSLQYLASLYDSMRDQVGQLDSYVQKLIIDITESTDTTINVTIFTEICSSLEAMSARLEKEAVTLDDYLVIQYATNLIGAVLDASVPVMTALTDASKTLTLEQVQALLESGSIPEEAVSNVLAHAEELAAILLHALSAMDQIGRYTDKVPSVSQLILMIGEYQKT